MNFFPKNMLFVLTIKVINLCKKSLAIKYTYVIMFQKKSEVAVLNCKIDYKLFTNRDCEIDKQNVDANYVPNKKLEFGENIIDFEKKTYTRKTNQYFLEIDFKSKICALSYDENQSFKFEVECSYKKTNEKIAIEYNLDVDTKRLIIYLKEVSL